MKKAVMIFLSILFTAVMFTGCGSEVKETDNKADGTSQTDADASGSSSTTETEETSSAGDCDEFLKGYEDFTEKYIALLEKYKSAPTDASILSDYTSMTAEATEWSTKTADCAADPKLAARFMEIQVKISNAVAGL